MSRLDKSKWTVSVLTNVKDEKSKCRWSKLGLFCPWAFWNLWALSKSFVGFSSQCIIIFLTALNVLLYILNCYVFSINIQLSVLFYLFVEISFRNIYSVKSISLTMLLIWWNTCLVKIIFGIKLFRYCFICSVCELQAIKQNGIYK